MVSSEGTSKTDTIHNTQLLAVAREAALAAGEQVKMMFSGPRQVTSKGFRDVVTDADVAAQGIITDMIRQAFPDHGFLTEEEDGDLPTEGPILWIIDPIDGTINYSRSVPLFCVSVAAVRNNSPLTIDDVLVGVVYDPMLDELFTATAGGPTLLESKGLHGRLLQTSSIDRLEDALISIDWPVESALRQEMLQLVNTFGHEVNVFRSLGTATLAMAWVAAGRLDGYLNYQFKAWDVAAAGLLVKQAGGVVSDVDGQPMELVASNMSGLLTNAHLAQYLVLKQ